MKGYYTADGDQLPLSTLRMRKEEMGLCVDRGISMRCKELPPSVALTARPGQGAGALLLRDAGPPSGAACPFGAARPARAPLGLGRGPAPACNPPRSDSLSLGSVSGLEGRRGSRSV